MGWLTVGLAGASLLVTPAAPAKRKPIKRPDLTVTSARLLGSHYVIKSDEAKLRHEFVATTKNVSKTRTAAPRTKTGLIITLRLAPHHAICTGPSVGVPKLRPRESDRSGKSGTLTFCPLGTYIALVCADVNNKVMEENEDNNCKSVGHFVVVPRKWSGTVSGNGQLLPGVTESWSGTATFALDPSLSNAKDLWYKPTSATTSWTVAGTDSTGCVYSGSGTDSAGIAHGTLRLKDYFDAYQGDGFADASFKYPITATCPPPYNSFSVSGPSHKWFIAAGGSETKPVHSFTYLEDSYSEPFVGTYEWNLDAVP